MLFLRWVLRHRIDHACSPAAGSPGVIMSLYYRVMYISRHEHPSTCSACTIQHQGGEVCPRAFLHYAASRTMPYVRALPRGEGAATSEVQAATSHFPHPRPSTEAGHDL